MKRIFLVALLAVFGSLASPAAEAKLRLSEMVCAKVRWGVAAFGPEAALQWARDRGYTSVQIMQAKSCLTRRGV